MAIKKRVARGVRTSKPLDNFIEKRIKNLKLKSFKSYFLYLLTLDGYSLTPNDF